ncbi:hypothetical protein WJX75_006986 [Coccomyxa subellipsoidea]|uniref:Knr4/Smi1-like domain-containing protein n=1 Tax=Coccomyxa subellipsoidea TaxID=248742 RepID=A0ABR2Z0B7_9CHLO
MRERSLIRQLLVKYIPFLDLSSSRSFQYGLEASEIGQIEEDNDIRLPWQEMLVGYAEAKKLQKPTTHEVAPEEGDACFPLTTERAGKQYCYDREGAIYLKYGWNCIRVADNLAGFLQLLLR